jgi:hypothetical protein
MMFPLKNAYLWIFMVDFPARVTAFAGSHELHSVAEENVEIHRKATSNGLAV